GAGAGKEYVYKEVEGRKLKLYVVEPEGVKEGDKRPGIVFFHGGGWVGGQPNQFDKQATYFASRGLVTVQVEYRLLEKGKAEAPTVCVEDAKSAMRWVRSHAGELGMDPKRIAAAGGSAGGHLAAAVTMLSGLDGAGDDLTVSPRADALILWNPVFNNGPGEYGYGRVGDKYMEYSPAHHVTGDTPPTVVFIGDKDHLIPLKVVKDFKAEMEKAGAKCELHVYPGADHGFFNDGRNGDGYYARETMRAADVFLRGLGWVEGEPTVPATTQKAE
ncbi:MAG TPA: alpha/beta hydrolase, partial [Tepidisphaeraceae bacterium]|nr:alpha/beta hydrolase [Tepidisphaeraceae bacterium]